MPRKVIQRTELNEYLRILDVTSKIFPLIANQTGIGVCSFCIHGIMSLPDGLLVFFLLFLVMPVPVTQTSLFLSDFQFLS